MNLLAKHAFRTAARHLDMAIAMHEEAATSGHVELIGEAFAELLRARGDYAAALQLIELEEMIAGAPTERPPLRLVR